MDSPCYGCCEKSCDDCACAICTVHGDVWWSTNLMESATQNQDDCDKFMERLWRENNDITWAENEKGEMVLDQKWRGFPVDVFTQDDWFHWVDAYHSKGVGWVFENIKR